jgi:hypothetical protein
VKKSGMALVCVLLLACWAQARPADPGAPSGTAAAPADPQSAPPAEQPAVPAAPAENQPPVQTGQPTITAPPELPKYPDVKMPGETGFWIGLGLSEPTGNPIFDKGRSSGFTTNSLITMQGRPKMGESAEIGFALGAHDALVISGFSTREAGNTTVPVATILQGQTYNQGVLVSTNYELKNAKVSFEYLMWPYPVGSHHFRLKTLWQVQYVDTLTGFDAPLLPVTTSTGSALLNSSGQIVSYHASGTHWLVTPTFGLGATEYLAKFVRLELNGSAFAIPRRWTIWDAEGSLNFRFGHFELGGGVRAFHIKTSTMSSYYVRGNMFVPQVALRWYLK